MMRLAVLLFCSLLSVTGLAATPPNVIIILADDMAIGDLSYFNCGLTRTPNLDRLIDDGLWFSHAYSGSPVCSPSRAALLTGRYPHRTGVVSLDMNKEPLLTRLHKDETTLATVFADNGYRTGLVGKWHTGMGDGYGPLSRGFQEFEGFYGSDQTAYFNYVIQTGDSPEKPKQATDQYLTDELSKRAVSFVRRHAERPFFLHLAHYAPHRPLEAPETAIQPYLKAGLDPEVATVYAMVEIMDRGIGELIAELEKLGIRKNTFIVFASDNGPDIVIPERFNVHLRGGKYQTYEGGIHVPLVMSCPDLWQAGVRDQIVHFTDLFPTLVELCGLKHEPKNKLDGVSLVPLLTGKGQFAAPARFWQWNRAQPKYAHNAALRDGPWKLVRPYVTKNLIKKGETPAAPVLYHMDADPQETQDLSQQHPARFEQMKTALEAWCQEVEKDRMRTVP